VATEAAARFRIRKVAAMTGTTAATLRAWERRYAVPTPARTAKSYRLYTEEDIQLIKQMQALCQAGLSAAQAAEQLRSQLDAAPAGALPCPMALLRDKLLESTRAYDLPGMQRCLAQLQHSGPAALAYEQILAPVLYRVGMLWAQGSLSIGQEHLLIGLAETTVRNLLNLVQPAAAQRSILMACAAGETHTLGLYGAGLRFAGWGYRVVVLGPSVPPAALAEAVKALRPDLIGLSTVVQRPELDTALCAAYSQAASGVPLLLGGAAAHHWQPFAAQHCIALAKSSPAALEKQAERLQRPSP
jgi:DNA-binding transcriptional MerR regulator